MKKKLLYFSRFTKLSQIASKTLRSSTLKYRRTTLPPRRLTLLCVKIVPAFFITTPILRLHPTWNSHKFGTAVLEFTFYIYIMDQEESVIALIIKCTNFAAIKHKNQRRKDAQATPYINHPIGVANILVCEAKVNDPEVLLAALLHDTVEDTDTSFEEIEDNFGSNVRKIVEEVTDDKTQPKEERKRLQIINAKNSSFQAKLVKLADKLYNLRDLQKECPVGWSEDRRKQYFIWAKQVVDNLRGVNSNLERELDTIFSQENA